MPLLLYFPLIVWMGMVELVQQEVRVPVKVKTQSRNDNAGVASFRTPARERFR